MKIKMPKVKMPKVKMSKEKLVMNITIGIACFALMLVMFMQFKVVKQTDITSIETMREEDLRTELADWREKYTELTERYNDVMTKISEYQTEKENDEKTAQLLQSDLEQLSLSLGTTNINGEGVTIILTDNEGKTLPGDEDVTISKITSYDLLLVLRELYIAGAEAISINDNRIVAMTDIFLRENNEISIMQIDSQRITSPYVIKAIGNKSYLESAANSKDGKLKQLQSAGHGVEVQTSSASRPITIGAYTGEIETKYMKDKN